MGIVTLSSDEHEESAFCILQAAATTERHVLWEKSHGVIGQSVRTTTPSLATVTPLILAPRWYVAPRRYDSRPRMAWRGVTHRVLALNKGF
jgi:hypothetical protein